MASGRGKACVRPEAGAASHGQRDRQPWAGQLPAWVTHRRQGVAQQPAEAGIARDNWQHDVEENGKERADRFFSVIMAWWVIFFNSKLEFGAPLIW